MNQPVPLGGPPAVTVGDGLGQPPPGWGAQRYFAPQRADLFRYQVGCSCFQYQSRPVLLP